MNWSLTAKDFEFMTTIEPFGCFVLFDEKDKIGIATSISYNSIGWFGNLVVKPESRNKRAGSCLLKNAITYLKNKDVQTIGLFSYPGLVDFYKKFGFKVDHEFIMFRGSPSVFKEIKNLRIAQEKDFPKIYEFDQTCMGFSRHKILNPIFSHKNNLTYFYAQNNFIKGYLVTKIDNIQAEIGPLVFKSDHEFVAVDLLRSALGSLSGFDVFIYVPKQNKVLIDLLLNVGLREDTNLVRMFLGPIINIDCLYLPESLERG
jgi:ribosomal protein S18 acetylase RimI-like enzyme